MSIRLILADDHPPLLQGLTLLLRQEPDFEVLTGCRNGEETLQAVHQFQPDVLILDILMPGKDGLAVLRELRQLNLPTRVILLTAAIDEDNLLEAMHLRVGGAPSAQTSAVLPHCCKAWVSAARCLKECARHVRRALDKTRATGRCLDLFSRKELDEHREYTGRLFSHGSLLSPA